MARNELKLDVVIDFVGGASPEEEADLLRLAADLGIEKHITLYGHLTDSEKLKQRYITADVFAFPSFYREGFPRVLYEAMMHGLPIVTTRMPGIEGFLVDGRNCLYCKARDPIDLSKTIERLVIDPNLAVKLGLAGHRTVEELFQGFEQHSHAEQVIALVEDLVKSGRIAMIERDQICR